MTDAQRLSIRLSEIRSRLNEIAGLEDATLTEEIRTEADALSREYQAKETQHRAAIVVESAEQRQAEGEFGNGDGSPAETRALLSRVGLADYVRASIGNRELAGATSELNSALDCPMVGTDGGIAIPWRVIRGQPAPELRQNPEARAFTTTGAYDGPTTQRPILDELFGSGSKRRSACNLIESLQSQMSNVVINGMEPTQSNPERIEGFLTCNFRASEAAVIRPLAS